MLIDLDPRTGEHRLEDVDDFTAFAVVVPSADDLPLLPATVPESLGEVSADGEHVVVRRDAVPALAGAAARSEEWRAGFDAMLAHAGHKGWLTPDGQGIQAHCTAAAPNIEPSGGT